MSLHTKEDSITFLVSPAEKRALKIMAAEANIDISKYLRSLLYKHTPIKDRARVIEQSIGKLPERETA